MDDLDARAQRMFDPTQYRIALRIVCRTCQARSRAGGTVMVVRLLEAKHPIISCLPQLTAQAHVAIERALDGRPTSIPLPDHVNLRCRCGRWPVRCSRLVEELQRARRSPGTRIVDVLALRSS